MGHVDLTKYFVKDINLFDEDKYLNESTKKYNYLKELKLTLALFRHDESLAAANGVMTFLVDKIDIH